MGQKPGWFFLAFLFFSSACNHGSDTDSGSENSDPLSLHYKIVRKYPHDTTAFTQGLEFYKGVLYEGTGEKGASQLRKLDLTTGKVLQKVDLDKNYFGEGITIFGDKIYQLTWQSHVVLQYDLSFKLLKEFKLPTEGWGMTHDSLHLIVSDGSSKIYYRDPVTMDSVKVINVTDNGNLVNNINELEYIHGFIYANIWQTDYIYKIDPATGNVVGKADFSNLLKHQGESVYDANSVLNGIAYDDQTGKIYITGKYWPALFEVTFQ
jgi:glutamine cyclotransferase